MGTQEIGKYLMLAGVVLLLAGTVLYYSKSLGFLGKLPGDIRIEKPGFSFYLPLGTSLLLSIILSLILFILSRMK